MHLKISAYAATIWTIANLAHSTDGLFPENYGWLMKNGKLLVKWYEDPTLPTNNFLQDERSTQENLNKSGFSESHNGTEFIECSDEAWSDDSDKVYLNDEPYIAIVTLMLQKNLILRKD